MKLQVTKVYPQKDFTLIIEFADGKTKLFDMKPLLADEINKPLRNIDFFMTAKVDHQTVAWSDDLDLCPEYIYEKGVKI